MGTVARLLAENVSFRCTSVDRIGVRGYVPGLQYEGGVLRFLLERGYRIPSPAGLTHNHDRLVSEPVHDPLPRSYRMVVQGSAWLAAS